MSLAIEAPSAMLIAAHDYARQSWKVFPLKHHLKKPATSNGFKDASLDPEQIKQWFSTSGYNIGIATGDGLAVLDIDRKGGKDGMQVIQSLEAIHGALPDTYKVSTPSGGEHWFFSYPAHLNIQSKANLFKEHGEGLDIRAELGYVVAAPSYTEASADAKGHTYTGDYIVTHAVPVAALPTAWAELLATKERSLAPPRAQLVAANDQLSEVQDALLYIPSDDYDLWVSIGKACYSLGNAGFNLWDTWSRGSSKYNPSEIPAKWQSFSSGAQYQAAFIFDTAARYGWDNPKKGKRDNLVGLASFGRVAIQSGEAHLEDKMVRSDKPFFISASELIANPAPIAWLIKDVMEQDSTIMLFGKSGDGKSFIALSMACSIASGLDWCGHKVEQGAVAYIAGEGMNGIKRRIAAWCQDSGVTVGQGLYLARHSLMLPEEVGLLISHLINIPTLRLVVLDTVQRTIGGDENNTKDAASYIRALDAIREALPEVSVMMVHHSGHNADSRARGSVVFKASSDLEMRTERDAENRLVLSCTKAKEAEPFEPMAFQFFTVGLLGWGDADNPVKSAVLHHLETVPPTQKQEDWRKKIRGSNQTTAMTILETMASASDAGWVKLEDWAKETLSQTGIKKTSRFHNEVSAKLEEKGFIKIDEGHVCLLVGKYAREELREEQGRIGKNWEELENQVSEERAELGRDVYIHLPILPSSTQESEFFPKPEYAEVIGL